MVEGKFSVQLRPKLNNSTIQSIINPISCGNWLAGWGGGGSDGQIIHSFLDKKFEIGKTRHIYSCFPSDTIISTKKGS